MIPGVSKTIKRLELQLRKSVTNDLIGNYRSSFPGSGLTFSELKEYTPGDEIKHIHWKTTARTGTTFVKSYEQERQLNILFIVDGSGSTQVGIEKSRFERIIEFTSLLGYLGKSNGDSLGLCLFSDEVKTYHPCKAKSSAYYKILGDLLDFEPRSKSSAIAQALEHVRLHQKRRALVFLLSDFFYTLPKEELSALAFYHDLICVHIQDEIDSNIPSVGLVNFQDAESGKQLNVNTSINNKNLKKREAEKIARLKEECEDSGADFISVEADPVPALIKLMSKRKKNKKRARK